MEKKVFWEIFGGPKSKWGKFGLEKNGKVNFKSPLVKTFPKKCLKGKVFLKGKPTAKGILGKKKEVGEN